jgi:hypothetical protein
MSTISAIGGGSTDLQALYRLLQQTRSSTANSVTGAATDSDGDNDGSTSGPAAAAGSTTATTGVSAKDLKAQIDAAVTAAMQNQPASGSATDLLQSIRSAISNTLKQNGINPQQMHHGHHAHRGGESQGQFQAQFEALLKQNGIDPKAFEQQLAAMTSGTQTSGTGTMATTVTANPSAVSSVLSSLTPQPGLNIVA